jgi:translation elongation factor EF-Tu-like GTPase
LKWKSDLLSFYEYDGDNGPVIQGSALGGLNMIQHGTKNHLELLRLMLGLKSQLEILKNLS